MRWSHRGALALVGVALLALACGGGGGGGGGPTNPGPSLVFTPEGGGGADSIQLRRSSASTADRLVLELVAEDLSALYGVAFDLQYPSSILVFDVAGEGSFLSAEDGVSTAFQVSEAPAGNLVVGLTRLGSVGGVSGSGVLLQLELRAVASGSGNLRFEDPQAFGPRGAAMPEVRWSGGSVRVIR